MDRNDPPAAMGGAGCLGSRARPARRLGVGDGIGRLVLVPTELEAGLLGIEPGRLAVCGFGLANAGAGAAHAILTRPEARGGVVLAGLAGTYDARRLPLGSVCVPGTVRCEGIGVGQGESHQSAGDLGWVESDLIELEGGTDGELLSVAAASASPAEAAGRTGRYPNAVAEDMEAYAVAVAARLAGVPLTVVRGISNVAGDRARERWRPTEAMHAVRHELAKLGAR